jgi:hypothetical protein
MLRFARCLRLRRVVGYLRFARCRLSVVCGPAGRVVAIRDWRVFNQAHFRKMVVF